MIKMIKMRIIISYRIIILKGIKNEINDNLYVKFVLDTVTEDIHREVRDDGSTRFDLNKRQPKMANS